MAMKIALLGYGTVARGVHHIIESSVPELEVVRVFCLPEEVDDPVLKTSDFEELLATPGLETVVEAMGGIEFARTCIMAALERGLNVVTSNKAVIAAHFAEFLAVCERTGAKLYIEATVGGGIPWIHNLMRASRIDEITSFSGILNGTTNYIIDAMAKSGAEFSDVLVQAQRLGYAEADPSADIDGIDVLNKTIISASVAFHVAATSGIPAWGIRTLSKADLEALASRDLSVKLMARGLREGKRYAACVTPVVIPHTSIEAQIPDNFNIATLEGATIGELKFYGQGAGGDPTGNAVVQDLLDCAQGIAPAYRIDGALNFEPRLLTSDWVVRTSASLRASDLELAAGYKVIRSINPVEARGLLTRLLKDDPTTFMAALPQE